jgi:hypothetical protein
LVTVTGYTMGSRTWVVTGSMDVSVHPGGGDSEVVQSLVRVINTSWVPPVPGNVRVVVNGGTCPGGKASAPASGARRRGTSTGTQSTTTAKVVPGAGAPVTVFVTRNVAQCPSTGAGATEGTIPSVGGGTVQLGGGVGAGPAAALVANASPVAAVLIANMPATTPRTTDDLVMIAAPSRRPPLKDAAR